VTPEAQEHLDKARESLIKARGLLDVMRYSDEAARAAFCRPSARRHAGRIGAQARTFRAHANEPCDYPAPALVFSATSSQAF